ncbi:MAG: RNA 2',3'-cyclic phosphodiesterase [Gammaproteobacteria bacterium]|nr:RNA 2',3'-cyclic phosphodiesterase [Gammaproteobacteria bacterium]
MTKRLFLGISPDSDQVAPLAALQQQLAPTGRPARLANLHMTLFYLGQCDHDLCHAITMAISQLPLAQFSVSLTTLELWQKPKIICFAGIAQDCVLSQLVYDLETIAVSLGLDPAPHKYRPHITLIRKAKTLPCLTSINTLTLKPQQLHLYHSVSSPMGVQYHIIKSWPLR